MAKSSYQPLDVKCKNTKYEYSSSADANASIPIDDRITATVISKHIDFRMLIPPVFLIACSENKNEYGGAFSCKTHPFYCHYVSDEARTWVPIVRGSIRFFALRSVREWYGNVETSTRFMEACGKVPSLFIVYY